MRHKEKDEGKDIEIPAEFMPGIDELTGDLRRLAGVVGVATAIRIGYEFDGVPLRLWGISKLKRRFRDNSIRQEYDKGAKVIELARKYKKSDRQIWVILGRSEEPTSP